MSNRVREKMNLILRRLLVRPRTYLLILTSIFGFVSFLVLVTNAQVFSTALASHQASLGDILSLFLAGIISVPSAISKASLIISLVTAIVFGFQLALLFEYYERVRVSKKYSTVLAGGGFLGVLSAIVGIGCASCGTVLATSLLASIGSTGLLAYLPLGGAEFAIAGLLILIGSSIHLLYKMQKTGVCE